MQNYLPSRLSGGFAEVKTGACFSPDLEAAVQQHHDKSSLSPEEHPCVWIRSISSQNRARAPSTRPLQRFPRCREQGAKVAQGCTQPLPFVETMLMCCPSVLAAGSLKHSNMPTVLIHCELVRLSDVDESSLALTAATFKPLNSALKLATH